MGTVLLCKIGCRDRMDFLYALRGIVPVDSATLMGSDFKREHYQVAWECLKDRRYMPPVLDGDTRFNDAEQLIFLKLEEIGVVSVIRRPMSMEEPSLLHSFSYAAKLALEFGGPDVKDFVAAVERTREYHLHGVPQSLCAQSRQFGVTNRAAARGGISYPWYEIRMHPSELGGAACSE
ncbi:hypothetical protein IWW34DRAFT_857075 [Fusarium oxysporum f. sp. albedinis]|nr:hypothetical protein IWW34DRAFT_857075 [Fusarium oxysporum f. sp. albedinis]KAK2471304.1 hypothetical protein H9L39_17535 [Fusarium oxysporum f. sp. albedinis]